MVQRFFYGLQYPLGLGRRLRALRQAGLAHQPLGFRLMISSGIKKHRNVRQGALRAQPLHQLETINPWHENVANDQVRMGRMQDLQGQFATFRRLHFISGVFEQVGQVFPAAKIVLDHKYFFGLRHVSMPLPLASSFSISCRSTADSSGRVSSSTAPAFRNRSLVCWEGLSEDVTISTGTSATSGWALSSARNFSPSSSGMFTSQMIMCVRASRAFLAPSFSAPS